MYNIYIYIYNIYMHACLQDLAVSSERLHLSEDHTESLFRSLLILVNSITKQSVAVMLRDCIIDFLSPRPSLSVVFVAVCSHAITNMAVCILGCVWGGEGGSVYLLYIYIYIYVSV